LNRSDVASMFLFRIDGYKKQQKQWDLLLFEVDANLGSCSSTTVIGCIQLCLYKTILKLIN
jgi:hypothetical protein